jgi:hypothetical protein
VYVPSTISLPLAETANLQSPKSVLPVVVFLHGGSFLYGSPDIFNGSLLAEAEGLIVVTPAYRLGPFGWLNLDINGSSAAGRLSLGLQDQQSALRWVQAHIRSFGSVLRRHIFRICYAYILIVLWVLSYFFRGDPHRVMLVGNLFVKSNPLSIFPHAHMPNILLVTMWFDEQGRVLGPFLCVYT